MARLFDDVQEEYLTRAEAVITAYPFAMACKFRVNDDTINNVLMWVGDKDVDTYCCALAAAGSLAGDPIRATTANYGGGSTGNAESSTGFTQDAWDYAAGMWLNVSERHAYRGGGSKGSNTDTVGAIANHDATAIGVNFRSTIGGYTSGDIAEAAIWDLTGWGANDAERETAFEAVIAALANGESPANYPTGLVAYWPLRDDDLDDAGSFDLTPINTPSWSTHPTVIYHLAGDLDSQSALTGNADSIEKLVGLIEAQSTLTGDIDFVLVYNLAGLIAAQSSAEGYIEAIEQLNGLIEAQSGLTGLLKSVEALGGSIASSSGLTGNLQWVIDLAGSIAGQSALTANLKAIQALAGAIGVVSNTTGNILEIGKLVGSVASQSALTGYIREISKLAGSIAGQSALTAKLRDLSSLSGTIDAQSTVAGLLNITELLTGSVAAQSSLAGNIQFCYGSIPPEMHSALIDPYSGGAWLWFVEIKIPGYSLIRYVRNPADLIYGGITYSANNFDVGLDSLSADGSVPRTILKVVQDANYTLEDKLNATQGGYGGRVTIIRAHEDFLTTPIIELERIVDILTFNSDSKNVIIPCGIPNPLQQKIPLRRGSSKICPFATPGLFKGIDCQYAGVDATCTGKYEDCFTKGNEIHWGGELGLDPSVTKV